MPQLRQLSVFALLIVAAGCGDSDTTPPGTGAGGVGGQAASSSSTSSGGTDCQSPADCAQPSGECEIAVCNEGVCTLEAKPAGTDAMQVAGNCQHEQCDGSGAVGSVADDDDLPFDDNECTDDVCTAGEPSNPPLAAGEACGQNDELVCDGDGSCVGCIVAEDCGVSTDCQELICDDNGTCQTNNAPAGTETSNQIDGDCTTNQCDGMGVAVDVEDDADLPDDGNACTADLCSMGTPSNVDEPVGTDCGTGSMQCDGEGECVECLGPADCPGDDNECQTRNCNNGVCGFDFTAAGFVVSVQTPGDCLEAQCDGTGGFVDATDDSDLPDDDNPCTDDICTQGVPSHEDVAEGISCGENLVCDGDGACVGCIQPSDCPGLDDECKTRTCTGGSCGFSFQPSGTVVTNQDSGDCRRNECNGSGTIVSAIFDTDLPADDGNACTDEACNAGVPQHPALPPGTECSQNGGSVCDASSTCVECLVADDCPGQDTECEVRTCIANTCGVAFTPAGTPTATQTPGDCRQIQCNGGGGTVSAPFNTDVPPDDGIFCTAETCVAGSPAHPPVMNGTACDDGSLCSQTDTCQEGVCVGSSPVTCSASDQCHVAGTCDPATGECSNPTAPDGTSCNDGDACSQTDTCQAGTCTGSNPVTCSASDQCHVAGTCDPATGTCSSPAAPDGTTCNDGDGCTQTDTCQAGTCTGGNPVTCQPLDACHVAGTCDPATGQCSNPPGNDGASCDDNDGCTQTDTCAAGSCVGSNPITCTALDACHVAGVCDPATGMCSSPNAPDGTACNDGSLCSQTDTCQNGTCTGSNPIVCSPSDQCHAAGTCDPATGACTDPIAPDGTGCDDGDLCTVGDACQAGVCSGGGPVTCAPLDACHVAGTCDPGTGLCDNPVGNEGNSCDDGDLCTLTDSCASGTCVGSNPVVCTPIDDCHVAGECNPNSGACSTPTAPDGTACTVGAVSGTCASGVCQLPPVVTTVAPASGATNIQSTTTIVVTFSQAMLPSSLTVKSTLDSGACSGAVQVSADDFASCVRLTGPTMSAGNTIATFSPAPGLAYGATYKVRVTTAAQGSGGSPLGAEHTQATAWTTRTDLVPVDGSVVISQVFAAGGDPGAIYANDFIELHNRGTTSVSLNPWALHFADGTGSTWTKVDVSGTIPAGGYMLIALGGGGQGGAPLPPNNGSGSVNLSPSAGKVVLTNNSGTVSGACPTGGAVVDKVGWGFGTTCFENAVALPPGTNALSRLFLGYTDNDNNSLDFLMLPPIPRNTSSAVQRFVVNETNLSREADYCNLQFPPTLTAQAGTSTETVYCRVFEAGETEPAGAAGTFTVEVGYGPLDANPQSQGGWTWVSAPFNAQFGNDEEYGASFTAPSAGAYRYACRVVRANTYTYCDLDGAGSNVGLFYEATEEGVLTSIP